jgi:hypothetical protein
MTLFMTLGWSTLGGWGGFVTPLLYGALALLLTQWSLEEKRLPVPAGIMATLAVAVSVRALGGRLRDHLAGRAVAAAGGAVVGAPARPAAGAAARADRGSRSPLSATYRTVATRFFEL